MSVPERSGSASTPAQSAAMTPAQSAASTPASSAASTPPPVAPSLISRLIAGLRQGAAFLVVGAIGFLVDAGTYNLLVFWGGEGVLYHAPLQAKIIAIAVATVVTYFGNKWWTFSHKQTDNPGREYLLYAVFNVVAIGLQLGCLGFSRYVLDLSTPLSDNISGTLIGQIVAVVFRYWAYDKFVFTGKSEKSDMA
ncbi:GtrA family protein [Nocardia sp. NPDC005366]|uniref:GtrA family protein n=1 Tax=Nocardia sp. NPDC005366 TaxID=3156878 RepID=UPI0033B129CA